jgi:transcriptional regulator with XRE-family HTH domain
VTTQVWLPEDGNLLKNLREAAGIEISTLARTHCLSTLQIKQLENGGDSYFYTSAIKLAAGRKLLMHFGADVQPFIDEAVHDPSPAQEISIDKVDIPQTALQTPVISKKSLYTKVVGTVVVFASLVYWGLLTSSRQSEIVTVNAHQEPISKTPFEKMADESKTSDSTVSIVLEKPKNSPVECQWSQEPATIVANRASKPGDYVHVVANTEGVICVRDATNMTQVVQLSSSQSQTIRGRQPFEIFSLNLNAFQLFYQGNLLRLPSTNTQTITLKEQKYE